MQASGFMHMRRGQERTAQQTHNMSLSSDISETSMISKLLEALGVGEKRRPNKDYETQEDDSRSADTPNKKSRQTILEG